MTNGQVILNQTTTTIPTNGVSEVQTLVIGGTPTAGTISFSWNGLTSPTTATWSATTGTFVANVQAALDWLFNSGAASGANCVVSNSTLSSGIGNMLITFAGSYSTTPQVLVVAVSALTGSSPTAAITRTTTGVTASDRQAASGELLVFTGTGAGNEVQTLTIGGSGLGGTFTISGATAQNTGQTLTTAAITWSGTNGTLQTNMQNALNTTFGTNNVTVSIGTAASGIGTMILMMTGTNSFSAMPLFTASGASMTGTLPTVAIARTTTGGTVGNTSAVPILYRNQSTTPYQPSWGTSGSTFLSMGSPVLGTTLTLHTAADSGSDQTFTTFTNQPDVARCLVSTPSGTTGNVTAVTDYVEGTDINGNFLSETLPAYTAGQATAVTSVNAFKTVTKYLQKANGTSVTITTKYSPKLGLPVPITVNGVVNGWLGGALEATRPVAVPSTTGLIAGNLISITSALNASAVRIDIAIA